MGDGVLYGIIWNSVIVTLESRVMRSFPHVPPCNIAMPYHAFPAQLLFYATLRRHSAHAMPFSSP